MPSTDISPEQSAVITNNYIGETTFANMRNDATGFAVDTTPDNNYYSPPNIKSGFVFHPNDTG